MVEVFAEVSYLHPQPVHLRPDPVVIGQVFDGPDGCNDRALVVNVFVAYALHQASVDGL